jgi:hypothetical protein
MNSLVIAIGKIALTTVVASAGAFGVAFVTAHYVSNAYLAGLTKAVEDLSTSVSGLGATVQSVDAGLRTDIQTLNAARNDLATAIADLAEVRSKRPINEDDVLAIKASVARIEQRMGQLPKDAR